jgi:hypothetical protein
MLTRIGAGLTMIAAVATVLGGCIDQVGPVSDRSLPDGLTGPDSIAQDSVILPDTIAPPDTIVPPDTVTADTTSTIPPLALLAPPDGAVLPQNDSTIGCPYHADRGYGFLIAFDWADADSSLGPVTYHVFVKKASVQYPLVDYTVLESETTVESCNGFVIDSNLSGWLWYARAHDPSGTVVAASDTSWFSFEPCRHPDGRMCTAPPGSSPSPAAGTGVH